MFTLPSVAGKQVSQDGNDYVGIGFDSSGLMGIVDVANVCVTEGSATTGSGLVSNSCGGTALNATFPNLGLASVLVALSEQLNAIRERINNLSR